MMIDSFLVYFLSILLAPLFAALILKVKAFFCGKKGPSFFFPYFTLIKLFQKTPVYSRTTTFIFWLAPLVNLSAILFALLFFPIAGIPPIFSFIGDVILVFYLLSLGKFFVICAAMDTGSPFEGMGASREAFFSCLAEVNLFSIFVLFYKLTGKLSFTAYFSADHPLFLWGHASIGLVLIVVALFMILLIENSRVPIDDPATHLELTMIHEVMVLDHSATDLAFITLASYLKLFFYASFIARLVSPFFASHLFLNLLIFFGIIFLVYMAIGVTEGVIARLNMNKIPKFILTSFALIFVAMIIIVELI